MLWVGPSFCACGSRVSASPERAHLTARASAVLPAKARTRTAAAALSRDLDVMSDSPCCPIQRWGALSGYLPEGQAYLSFGLSASRSQSPRRFTANAKRASVNPGNATIHQEPENRYLLPTWIMVPSEGSVGGRPTPRNDSVASVMMASARLMVAITSTGPSTLGRMC